MTPEQVHDAIEAWWKTEYPNGYSEVWSQEYLNEDVPGLGPVKFIEYNHFGDEDCTGRVQQIVQVGDVFYAKWGMYYSHVGCEWDFGEFEQVEKQVVTETVTRTEWS